MQASGSRIVYMDESSFNIVIDPLKCWQYEDRPAIIPMATKRPANVTLFGAICNRIPNAMFMVAQSTNQHDVVRFLKSIRASITQAEVERDLMTFILLDNHVAHKTRLVQ